MKTSILLLSCLLLSTSIFSEPFIDSSRIAILPIKYNNGIFFVPTDLDIDKGLNTINRYFKNRFLSNVLSKIYKNRSNYCVQVSGELIENEPHIVFNFLPVKYMNNDKFTNQYIIVMDGGFWFWTIFYNIKTHKIFKIYINGEA